MKRFKTIFFAVILFCCGYILFFQPEWLGIVLIRKPVVPLGTLISWVLIADYALLVNALNPFQNQIKWNKKFGIIMKIYISLSMLWGVISFLLSGNWLWSFQHQLNFLFWILFTGILVVFPFPVFVLLIFRNYFRRKK